MRGTRTHLHAHAHAHSHAHAHAHTRTHAPGRAQAMSWRACARSSISQHRAGAASGRARHVRSGQPRPPGPVPGARQHSLARRARTRRSQPVAWLPDRRKRRLGTLQVSEKRPEASFSREWRDSTRVVGLLLRICRVAIGGGRLEIDHDGDWVAVCRDGDLAALDVPAHGAQFVVTSGSKRYSTQ